MTDISAASISPDGYLVLQADTTYNLFGNLVLDGVHFKGVSGGNTGTYLNGQGYTITVSGSYDANAAFPTPIHLSHLTLINPTSAGSWGSATADGTCYAFTGPLTGPTIVSVADISSGDQFIHLLAGKQYKLSGNLAVSAGVFNGFKVEGMGNVLLDGAGRTVTMTADGGLMTNAGTANLLVKNIIVDATDVALANGNGWIFGSGFTASNMIAVGCHVMCGGFNGNSGGIFGGQNNGFVCATGCSVVCGTIANSGSGGGGGICGGYNNATITITDCTATIGGDVTNDNGTGGGGGMCGGLNGYTGGTAIITITGCTATIGGDVTNTSNGNGGGGGMCGGHNGFYGITTIIITDCTATITGSVTNTSNGGGGGMCGGFNGFFGTTIITITGCTATIGGDVTNTGGGGGGGGMCGGVNGYVGTATISITGCILYVSSTQNGIILGGDSYGTITVMDNQIITPSQFPTSLFPTSLFGYYYATGSTFLYNQKTILSFVAAPRGARNWTQGEYLPVGTPLQDTGRRIIAFGRNHLKTHEFREVQHAGGAGYLCVWAASGVAPSSL